MLHRAGVITYTRGNVTLLDKSKLENAACDCYSAIQNQLKNWESEIQEN